MKTHTVILRFK